MIVIKLMGGLGNQMFQYAVGRHLSIKNNAKLCLDLSFLNTDPLNKYTKRDLELNLFNIEVKTTSNFFSDSLPDRIIRKFQRIAYIHESRIFNTDFFTQKGNLYLDGFWQTEDYFKEIKETLLKDFRFPDPDNVNLKWCKAIKSCESVSIHVRRGDYLNADGSLTYHGTCSIDYYQKAIKVICNRIANPSFFIFSDDTEWVKKNLIIEQPHHFINHNEGTASYRDMQLMSVCKHNIIANSSFSWWGAWLNTNANKLVIAPSKWFAKDSPDNIVPTDWITI